MKTIEFEYGLVNPYNYAGRFPTALRSVGNKTIIESIIDEHKDGVRIKLDDNTPDEVANIISWFLIYKGYFDKTNFTFIDKPDYTVVDVNVPEKSKCRFFNSIKIKDDIVIKTALDDKGKKLHDIEVEFYKKIKSPSMCKMISYDDMSMILERINGVGCQEAIDNGYDKVELIEKFKDALSSLNKIDYSSWCKDTCDDMVDAAKNELFTKIYDRVNPCKKLIDHVTDGCSTFNSMKITPFEELMVKVKNWLDNYKMKFAICHGDPNTDNVMLDNNGNIKMIDPRGYFGNLKTIGLSLIDYDIAKFVYGMSGYGHFNSTEALITDIVDGNVQATLYDGTPIMKVDMDELPISDDIKIIVGVIWMKLTSYIINDPVKSIAAYLHGNALLTKYL